jgi:hypothetical protein
MRRSVTVLLLAAACAPAAAPPATAPTTPTQPEEADSPVDLDCPAHEVSELVRCVERNRIESDVRAIAKPRPPGSAHHRRVRELCATRLGQLGYQVERHDYGSGLNVIGSKPGASKAQVVLSAHYDHIPQCSGADDNASGVAAVLEAARVLAGANFRHTLVVACWDEEEDGLLGSRAYARRARERGDEIIVAISLDAVGAFSDEPNTQHVPPGFDRLFPKEAARLEATEYRANFVAVLGDTASESFVRSVAEHAELVGLPTQSMAMNVLQKLLLSDAHRSDHASFWLAGFPALLLTDTADFRNPRYHCGRGDDHAGTVHYEFTAKVTQASVGMVADALDLTTRN